MSLSALVLKMTTVSLRSDVTFCTQTGSHQIIHVLQQAISILEKVQATGCPLAPSEPDPGGASTYTNAVNSSKSNVRHH